MSIKYLVFLRILKIYSRLWVRHWVHWLYAAFPSVCFLCPPDRSPAELAEFGEKSHHFKAKKNCISWTPCSIKLSGDQFGKFSPEQFMACLASYRRVIPVLLEYMLLFMAREATSLDCRVSPSVITIYSPSAYRSSEHLFERRTKSWNERQNVDIM